eukprot:SAG11_NODE_53404_length_103_cov_384.000000_1_plen_34_part_11
MLCNEMPPLDESAMRASERSAMDRRLLLFYNPFS